MRARVGFGITAVAAIVLGACGTDGAVAPTTSPTEPPSSSDTVTVSVFFVNERLGDVCEEVFPVDREVSAAAPLRGALEQLMAGPTAAERADGYEGWFSDATAHLLDGVRIEGGRAHVDLVRDLPFVIPNASSSCGSRSLLGMLDATATQFPDVDEAWYSLEGDRADFYGWLQMAAPDDPGLRPEPTPSVEPTLPGPSSEPTTETPTTQTPTVEPTAAPTTSPTTDPPPSARAVPASLVGTEWLTLPGDARVVALTFDAGANGDGVPSILRTLAEEGVPGTFFLTGRWVTAYPTYAAQIGTAFPVGNHSQSHPDLTTLSDDAVRDEVLVAADAITGATARDTRPWFRFPYGARDARTIATVNDLGFGSVRWTTDTLGWKGTSTGQSVTTVVQRVMDDLRPSQIVLMHVGSHPTDGSTLDADALPDVIRRIRDAGYDFVDLDDLLTDS
jgi:peptidoglycan/xylan/chitin deacetylase (PgdA/CDA1 family)